MTEHAADARGWESGMESAPNDSFGSRIPHFSLQAESPALFSYFVRAYQRVTRSGGRGNASSIQGCFFPHRSHVPGAFCHLRSLRRQYFALTWAKTSRDFSTTSILKCSPQTGYQNYLENVLPFSILFLPFPALPQIPTY